MLKTRTKSTARASHAPRRARYLSTQAKTPTPPLQKQMKKNNLTPEQQKAREEDLQDYVAHAREFRKRDTPLANRSAHLTAVERKKLEKKEQHLILKGSYFELDNMSHPIPEGHPQFIDHISAARQYRNTYNKFFGVPCLYYNDKTRVAVSKTIDAGNNQILTTLRKTIQEYEQKGRKLYLIDLPTTPDIADEPDRIYVDDPPEYALPPNKFLDPSTAATGFGTTVVEKMDMMELFVEQNPDSPLEGIKFRAFAESTGFRQGHRVVQLIINRCRDPKLYQAFGLDEECHHTKLAMYALHVWFYMRGIAHRPVYNGEYLREFIIGALDTMTPDSLNWDWRIKNASDRHLLTSLFLPMYRMYMINLDKAMVSLAGGDPEPMYSIMYRMFYRNDERERFESDMSKRTDIDHESCRGVPYTPEMEVYMADPPDLAYVNNLINYITNVSYDLQTKLPRDYNLVLNGYVDLVDYPVPPRQKEMQGKIKKEEMERWCFTVWQATKSPFMPNFFQRLKSYILPEQMPTDNWFLNPKTDGLPAWRPPQFSLTATGRKP